MHPSCKSRKENIYLGAFYGVVGSYIALYLVHLGYQYYLVRARCLKYTILSAPLHPHFGNYLLGWVTHTHYWHDCMCHS